MDLSRSLSISVGDVDVSDSNINIGYFGPGKGADREAELARYRKALYVADPRVERDLLISSRGRRAPNTCQWIKDDMTYQKWLASDKALLRILGSPGKGKTMFSTFLVEEMDIDRPVLYALCRSGRLENASDVLRVLIWPLVEQCEGPEVSLKRLLELDHEPRLNATLNSPETSWSLFTVLLKRRQGIHARCIIDGADECDIASRDWLMERLISLASEEAATESVNLSSIVLSRPFPTLKNDMCMELALDSNDAVEQDIHKASLDCVAALRKRVRGVDDDFATTLEAKLQAKAQGTFLWIGFAIVELRMCQTRLQIERIMKSLPAGLPQLYDRMILQIPATDRKICSRILRWVTLAANPLILEELAGALGLQSSASHVVDDFIAHCGPLLVRRDSWGPDYEKRLEVHLVHQSAKDYLLREEAATDSILEAFRIKIEAGHADCARDCLNHLTPCLATLPSNAFRSMYDADGDPPYDAVFQANSDLAAAFGLDNN